jgi:hypothetical protein
LLWKTTKLMLEHFLLLGYELLPLQLSLHGDLLLVLLSLSVQHLQPLVLQ